MLPPPGPPRPEVPHRHSHVGLLRPVVTVAGPYRPVDAVVVPTVRPVETLREAVDLAGALDCPVIVLCSGRSRAAEVVKLFRGAAGLAVTLSSTPRIRMLELRTQRSLSPLAKPYLDTGNKRNVGLLLGRLLGWRHVLFLDDDIRGLRAGDVLRTAATLGPGGFGMVGWTFTDFPDNSVACHALRSSGADQDAFIGAGALLVDIDGRLPFFPAVYNEDWLFWHDRLRAGQVGVAGSVSQVGHDPFDDPHRARQQEFGDVLAEGLYSLIHEGRSVLTGCAPAYWEAVLAGRRRMLEDVDRRLRTMRARHRTHTPDGHLVAKVLRSVAASRAALGAVTALDLAEFTLLWRVDLHTWNARLHRLPRFEKVRDALDWLGVTDAHLSGWA